MRRKLNLGFFAITFLICVICTYTLLSSMSVRDVFVDLKGNVVHGAMLMAEMERDALEIRMWTTSYIVRGNVIIDNKTIREWLHQDWAALETKAKQHLELEHQVIPGEVQVAQVILDLSQKLISVSAEIVDLKDQGVGNDELFEKVSKEFGAPVFYPLRRMLNEHAAAHYQELLAAGIRTHNIHNATIRYITILGLVATFLALAIGFLVDRRYVRFITERKRAEETLQESEERFRVLTTCAQDPIVMIDHEDRISFWNQAAEGVFGYDTEEILGKPAYETLAPARFHKASRKGIDRFRETGEGLALGKTLELAALRKDGTEFPIELSLSAVQLKGKWNAVAIIRDITRRKRAEEALKESEVQYRTIFESAADALYIVDTEGVIQKANPAACKLQGYAHDELVGLPVKTFVPPEKLYLFEFFMKATAIGEPVTLKSVNVRKDGSKIDVEIRGTPIIFRGKPHHLTAMQDITERKRAEEVLKESEEKFRTIMSSSPDAITLSDLNGVIIDCNQATLDTHSFSSKNELIDLQSLDFIAPQDRQRAVENMKKTLEQGIVRDVEYTLLTKDGRDFPAELSASLIHDSSGKPAFFLGITRDITERKRAEEKLRKSEEKYRDLTEKMVDIIYTLDTEGSVTSVNKAIKNALGFEPEEVIGKNFAELIPQEERPKTMAVFQRILNGEQATAETILVDKNGKPHNVEFSSSPVIKDNKTMGTRGIVRDITERKRAERSLRESEERYRVLFEGSAEGILVADVETRQFKYVNPAVCKMLGYTEEELKGMSVTDIHPQDALEHVISEFEAQARGENTLASNIPCLRKDGTTIYTDINTTIALIEGRECNVGFITDITERKRAEEKLRLFSQTINSSIDGIAIGDLKGRITHVNNAFTRMFGCTKEELIGKEIASIYADDQITKLEEALKATIEGGWTGELVAKRKDGILFPIAITASRVVNDEGKVIAQMASHQDITKRKQAEEELRKLSAAVIQSANRIVITDTDGVIEYVNPQFSRMTGYTLVEAVGKPVSILKSGKQDREFYADLWQTIKSGKTWSGKLQNRRKNGDIYWERQTIAPIFDQDNLIINFLSIAEDITIEIMAQQKLIEADKMSAVGMLAAGVAHEFKNYLAGIIGNASFALGELEQEGGLQLAGETLSEIVKFGEKANDIAMSLLTFSKIKPDDLSREDIKKIITKVIGLVEKEMKNRSIEIVTSSEEIPEVEVSTSKIEQLLLNLLINAQHAIKSDGVITINLLAKDGHIMVKVGDTGVGIPEENLSKIFDPFFSTKGVWGKDELIGTGMGLTISRNIAREHGGDLAAESVVGVGTTFILTLPACVDNHEAPQAAKGKGSGMNVLLFTLDNSVVSQYSQQACSEDINLQHIDDVSKLPDDLRHAADLVICDAKFTAKVELYRMVETCRRLKVLYVMINCGKMEYQLADLYENAVANFKQLPDFSRIISAVTHPSSEVTV